MPDFPTDTLDSNQSYKLISAAVTPRPIAWVSTRNDHGGVNLAPFSSYTFISYAPPKVLVSIGPGTTVLKDTLANATTRREFCVSAVTADLLEPMVNSSYAYDSHESEAETLGVSLRDAIVIGTPYVANAALAMECELDRIIEVGDADAHRLIIGTVVCFHVDDSIWNGDRIDPEKYRSLGRIGGPLYVTRGELLHAPTPRHRVSIS